MYQYSNSLIRQFPSSVTGNAAVGVHATVYVGETNTLAQLFEVSGTAKANPVTTDGKGFYSFSLADGDYRIVFSSSQFSTLRISVLDGAQIREDFEDLVSSNAAFRSEQQAAYDSFVLSQGWDHAGTFAAGFTFTSPNQVGQDVDGNWWRWNGALPKVVAAGTLPSSDSNYTLVGDGVLRSDLATPNSTVLVGGVEAGELLQKAVTPEMFGAKGDYSPTARTGTDDTAAFQAMFNFALVNLVSVKIPSKCYLISSTINIDATDGTQRMFKMIGDGVGTSAEQSADGRTFSRPAIFFTGSGSLFFIDHNTYFFNMPFIQGVNFFQPTGHASWQTASLIKFRKGTAPTYPRNAKIIDCNFSGWKNIWDIYCETGSATDPEAYVGPTMFIRCHLRECRGFVSIDNVAQNRFFVDKCYIHPQSGADGESAFKLKNNGWVYLTLRDSTFEGCHPAVFDMSESNLISTLALDNVASEYSGNRTEDGAWGFIKPFISETFPCRLKLYISNNGYDFFDMPQMFRLWRGAEIASQAPCLASGVGFIITTPETVRPVVGPLDYYTTALVQDGYFRVEGTEKLIQGEIGDTRLPNIGRTWTANGLPSPMRGKTTGIGSWVAWVANGEYIAPSDGFMYLSFTVETTSFGRLSSNAAQRQVTIARPDTSVAVIELNQFSFSEGGPKKRVCVVVPVLSGERLSDAHIEFFASEFGWSSFVDFTFSPTPVIADVCCGASEAKTSKTVTVDNGATVTISGPKVGGDYTMKARLSSGRTFAEYQVSGNVGAFTVPSRDVQLVSSSLESGVTVTSVVGGNDGYSVNLQIQNTTGVSKIFRLDCEYTG